MATFSVTVRSIQNTHDVLQFVVGDPAHCDPTQGTCIIYTSPQNIADQHLFTAVPDQGYLVLGRQRSAVSKHTENRL